MLGDEGVDFGVDTQSCLREKILVECKSLVFSIHEKMVGVF